MPRILFIVPDDYDALRTKGVDGMIFERDEGGYFERVVTVHPIAHRNRIIEFNDVFVLHELGRDTFGRVSNSRFLRTLLAPLHFIRAAITIFKLVHSEKIDLIRANDPFWMGLLGLVVAKMSGRPLCVSIHAHYDKCQQLTGGAETYTFFGMQWPARLVCRLVFSSADMILPIRESIARWAVSNGASFERIRIIPHGVDTKAFEAGENRDIRSLFNIPADSQIISFVGRLSPENYLVDILKMARRLAAHRDDFCLVIAGEGKLEGWLKDTLAVDSRLRFMVRLVGFQPRNVCFSLRCQSAVSLCLMGGFGLIEACLARRPVVSYDVDWHSELVQNGKTGFLLSEGDIDGLLGAVEQCLNEPAAVAKLGEQAYNLAVSRHELKNTSQIKRKCYEELLRRD